MTDDEKLVAEIKRLCDETDTETNEPTQAWLVGNLRATIARHEAHTPTDDEREALTRLFDGHWMTPLGKCACGWVHPQYGSRHLDPIYVRQHLANVVAAAGFRRSEVPEPSAERPEIPGRIWLTHPDGTPKTNEEIRAQIAALNAGSESQGEPSSGHDRDRNGICRACGHGLTAAEILDGERPCVPQGEPSDAQVLAAVDAFMASQLESEDGPSLVHKNMAAALRAAASTPESPEDRAGGAR